MRKVQYFFVIASILVGGLVLAGEPTKEELQARLETKQLQMEMLKRDTVVTQFIQVATEANQIQQKIQALDKAEADRKAEADKKAKELKK